MDKHSACHCEPVIPSSSLLSMGCLTPLSPVKGRIVESPSGAAQGRTIIGEEKRRCQLTLDANRKTPGDPEDSEVH